MQTHTEHRPNDLPPCSPDDSITNPKARFLRAIPEATATYSVTFSTYSTARSLPCLPSQPSQMQYHVRLAHRELLRGFHLDLSRFRKQGRSCHFTCTEQPVLCKSSFHILSATPRGSSGHKHPNRSRTRRHPSAKSPRSTVMQVAFMALQHQIRTDAGTLYIHHGQAPST